MKLYPDKLIDSNYGLLSPDMFCPNKALHSLHYMSMDAKESYNQLEVWNLQIVFDIYSHVIEILLEC